MKVSTSPIRGRVGLRGDCLEATSRENLVSRLIVVSNRVAPAQRGRTSTGGLAVALLAALKESGGIWLGWSGEVTASPAQAPKMVPAGQITYATLDLSQKEYTDYYNGFANSSLWPLFHYRLDLCVFSRQYFDTYQRVNARFAAALVPLLKPGDIIWIHDYHLMMMADALRRAGVNQPIGFFLHTPFPAHQILTALPRDQTLIRALLAYDLIGFQTEGDLVEFRDYILHEAGGELLDGNRVRAFRRTARAQAFPISIDTDNVATLARQSQKSRRTTRLKESLAGRDLIVGVDRLDYSKGLVERFHAFERLLQRYNDLRNRVVLMQIAPPSRADVAEYMEIRRTLETAAGHINGRFAEFDWVPVRYLNKSFSRRALMGFFRTARVGLVTPLRDGMNLVAKEYIAAQSPRNPGVLVLSRFAGAAQELTSALIVNPFDVEDVADALQKALKMPIGERRERWRSAMDILRRNDVTVWREKFVEALRKSHIGPARA